MHVCTSVYTRCTYVSMYVCMYVFIGVCMCTHVGTLTSPFSQRFAFYETLASF